MNLKKIAKYLVSKEYIAGLSIRDTGLHFLLFSPDDKNKILASFEAELPQAVIVGGELKQPETLKPILEGLRHSAELKKIKHLYIILSLESGTVYHKVFDLPQVDLKELKTAIDLNMKMLSPIKFEEAYSDWELMTDILKQSSFKYRINSVFAKKTTIDPYLEILTETNFIPLAVEFNALSFWRLFNESNLLSDESKSYLIIFLSADGLDFMVAKKTGLGFNYFQTWREAFETLTISASETSQGVLNKENFFKIFTEELRKVINFYLNRFQEGISNVFLFTPAYQEELEKIIEEQFHLSIIKEKPKFAYSPGFFAAAGAALRGLISRVDDVSISLMAVGTEEEYHRRRALNFINLWSKIVFATLILLIVASFGTLFFLNVTTKSLKEISDNLTLKINEDKLRDLQEDAEKFNELVNQAIIAQKNTKDWSGFFTLWQTLGPEIRIEKLIISSLETPVVFSGWTNTREKMLDFKKKLTEATDYFSNVNVPLHSIIQSRDGVEFNLNFKIDKLP